MHSFERMITRWAIQVNVVLCFFSFSNKFSQLVGFQIFQLPFSSHRPGSRRRTSWLIELLQMRGGSRTTTRFEKVYLSQGAWDLRLGDHQYGDEVCGGEQERGLLCLQGPRSLSLSPGYQGEWKHKIIRIRKSALVFTSYFFRFITRHALRSHRVLPPTLRPRLGRQKAALTRCLSPVYSKQMKRNKT